MYSDSAFPYYLSWVPIITDTVINIKDSQSAASD